MNGWLNGWRLGAAALESSCLALGLPMSKHLAPLLMLVLLPLAARAGSAVGESIWNKQAAIDVAMQSVPAGAQVTGTSCQEVEVGTGNYHYICTVTYSEPLSPSR